MKSINVFFWRGLMVWGVPGSPQGGGWGALSLRHSQALAPLQRGFPPALCRTGQRSPARRTGFVAVSSSLRRCCSRECERLLLLMSFGCRLCFFACKVAHLDFKRSCKGIRSLERRLLVWLAAVCLVYMCTSSAFLTGASGLSGNSWAFPVLWLVGAAWWSGQVFCETLKSYLFLKCN